MADEVKRKGLGRGLSALLGEDLESLRPGTDGEHKTPQTAPIEALRPNPDQPRKTFDEGDLEELTASIREKGVIQPILVRESADEPGAYEIVAGERRWRAAQRARQHEVPIVVRQLSDAEVLELSIIENVQRADLNPVEEATGYTLLIKRFDYTQEQLAKIVGKSRSYIANLLRLLTLPADVIALLREGRITAGHARALITAENPSVLAEVVASRGLSVRETERMAKKVGTPKPRLSQSGRTTKDADTLALEGDISAALRMPVTIEHRAGAASGEIRISYGSLEKLDELCRRLCQADSRGARLDQLN